jgi:hypothetical protein
MGGCRQCESTSHNLAYCLLFQVFDMPLHSVYATLDGASVAGLLGQAGTLQQHWSEMTKVDHGHKSQTI